MESGQTHPREVGCHHRAAALTAFSVPTRAGQGPLRGRRNGKGKEFVPTYCVPCSPCCPRPRIFREGDFTQEETQALKSMSTLCKTTQLPCWWGREPGVRESDPTSLTPESSPCAFHGGRTLGEGIRARATRDCVVYVVDLGLIYRRSLQSG